MRKWIGLGILAAVLWVIMVGMLAAIGMSPGWVLVLSFIPPVMALVVSNIADERGHDALPWFLYAALVWPFALIHILLTKPDRAHEESKVLATGDVKKCPMCAELIKREANKCRYCGTDFAGAPRAT